MQTMKKVQEIKSTNSNVNQEPKIPEKDYTNDIPIERRIQVAICIPCYGTVTASWMIEFMRFMMLNMKKYVLNVIMHEAQPVSCSRNELVDKALVLKPDYILWLDSDNIAPNTTIDRLLETMKDTGADLVSALYFGKNEPHYPVIRQWRSKGFYTIENPKLGSKFPIAGCGFGCCLIKPEVFNKLEKPYFKFSHETWGEKDIVLSEDLYFCRKMIDKRLSMYCDAGVISSHIGGEVGIMNYVQFAPIRESTMLERDEMMTDMATFLNVSQETVDLNMMVGDKLFREEWIKKNPVTFEEQKKFYKETENYLYDLGLWHFSGRRRWDIELLTNIKGKSSDLEKKGILNGRKIKVLDFGSGIGQNAMMLARSGFDVTIADLDSKTLDFAEYRFKKNNLPYRIWRTDVEEAPPLDKYDFILSFDVFEHLPADELKKVIDKLIKLKLDHTEIIATVSFGFRDSHPEHYESSSAHDKELKRFIDEK